MTALSLPFYLRQAPESGQFLTTWAMLACGADLLTAFLMLGQFGGTRSPSLAVLAAVYLLSGLMVIPHVLTFPGVFAPTGLLHAGSQTAAWLWSFWHADFTIGLVIYLIVDARSGDTRLSPAAARRLLTRLHPGRDRVFRVHHCLHHRLRLALAGDHGRRRQAHLDGPPDLTGQPAALRARPGGRLAALAAAEAPLGGAIVARRGHPGISVRRRAEHGRLRPLHHWLVCGAHGHGVASVLVLCVLLYEVSRLYTRLSESEADLRGLVERAPVGMSVSNEDGTMEVVNAAYCQALATIARN